MGVLISSSSLRVDRPYGPADVAAQSQPLSLQAVLLPSPTRLELGALSAPPVSAQIAAPPGTPTTFLTPPLGPHPATTDPRVLRVERCKRRMLAAIAATKGWPWERGFAWRSLHQCVADIRSLSIYAAWEQPPTIDSYALQATSLAQARDAWKEALLGWLGRHPRGSEAGLTPPPAPLPIAGIKG